MAKFRNASYHTFGDMNYFLLFLVQYRQSTEYRQTDRKRCILHICTGGLKNRLLLKKILLLVTEWLAVLVPTR